MLFSLQRTPGFVVTLRWWHFPRDLLVGFAYSFLNKIIKPYIITFNEILKRRIFKDTTKSLFIAFLEKLQITQNVKCLRLIKTYFERLTHFFWQAYIIGWKVHLAFYILLRMGE